LTGGKQQAIVTKKDENQILLWKKLLNAENDPDVARRKLKQRVWETLSEVVPYLRHNSLPSEHRNRTQSSKDYTAKFSNFMKAYSACWGADGTIHYMHLCWQHLPYQINKWGALFIWSSSSMEKSHWKAHNQFHTRYELLLQVWGLLRYSELRFTKLEVKLSKNDEKALSLTPT
jgi:hypothetical protein